MNNIVAQAEAILKEHPSEFDLALAAIDAHIRMCIEIKIKLVMDHERRTQCPKQ